MLNTIGGGVENSFTPEHKNQQNKLEINNYFIEGIDFLQPIQFEFRKNVAINQSGRIDRKQLFKIKEILGGNELIDEMDNKALSFYNSNNEDIKGFTDCVIIAGTLICIYDSSKETPKYFRNSSRGEHKNISNFSIIGIDCNESKRDDGVLPDTSLHHEFQHHLNTTLGDKLLLNNSKLNFFSAERGSNQTNGFKSKSNFVAKKDSKIIESLFSRPINLQSDHPAVKTSDYQRYENQLYYLDELSASWGQAKNNIFGPKKKFYNNVTPGKHTHYELIGDSPEDKKDLIKLFKDYLMPGIYLFELVKLIQTEIDKQKSIELIDSIDISITESRINELQGKMDNINNLISLITQTIGVSRTVHQALELITNIWDNKILSSLSSDYKKYIYSGGEMLKKYL